MMENIGAFQFLVLSGRFKIIVIVVLITQLLSSTNIFAQNPHYEFLHLTIKDGLSNSQVMSILQDQKGYMWFGTLSGLNRFDGYNFKVFRHKGGDSLSIRDNYIDGIYEDHLGRIWANTRLGLNIYNPETDGFVFDQKTALKDLGVDEVAITKIHKDREGKYCYLGLQNGLTIYSPSKNTFNTYRHSPGDHQSIHSNNIHGIGQGKDGTYWIIYSDGTIDQLDPDKNRVIFRSRVLNEKYGNRGLIFNIFVDSEGNPWVYTSDALGVFTISNKSKEEKFITTTSEDVHLNKNLVRGIAEDDNGNIWITTDHGGINIYNKNKNSIQYILHNEEDEKSLSNNSIYSILKDNSGIIWIGTYKKGISYYHPDLIKFRHYKRQISDPESLSFDDINCFEEDDLGNIWIGTNGGGLIYYDRIKNQFITYKHDPTNPSSLSNDVIINMSMDSDGILWVGTFYGGLDKFDGNKFEHYKHDPDDSASINDNKVYEIFEDSDNNLWVGSLAGGLELMDRNSGEFKDYSNLLPSKYISGIVENEDGKLWIASAFGLIVFNRFNESVKHYLSNENQPTSISNDNLIFIYKDSRGLIWIASRDGLNLYNKANDDFIVFRKEDGLCDNTIQGITEDHQNNIWVTSSNGVSNILVHHFSDDSINVDFINYDISDGLQGLEFNANGILTTSSGEVIFGGHQGMNIVNPREIRKASNQPKLIFTDFQVFNTSVKVGEKLNDRVLLQKAIDYGEQLELKYDEKIFSIEFAALSYFHPEKYNFQYKLEGFNPNWIFADPNQRKATYTNLDPGDYTFKVRILQSNGEMIGEERSLYITILPPFWKTSWAIFIYIIVLIGVLLLSRQIILERERLNYKIKRERFESQRMHELDMMKIRFFTNISHEFRTPLMLIISPIEKLLKAAADNDQQKQIQLVSRNAKRLLKLVNQLLDFRKMEVDELRLHPSGGDVIKFIKDIADSFTDLAESSNIDYQVESNVEQLEMLFDQDKFEKIIYNLLSNAFKFTPTFKSVRVSVEANIVDDSAEQNRLIIKISDTGIGIPIEMQEKVFDRFVQSNQGKNMVSQGSGIGLALTREFVKLHDGEISVESEVDKGSCFTVSIPIKVPHQFELDKAIKDYVTNKSASSSKNGTILQEVNEKRPTVLLAEDNEDFRFYLKDNLRSLYEIIDAPNGKVAWEYIESNIPDLVVSDIVMPEMNGIELCERIKSDHKTSHIPVILLSAQTDEEQKLKGFEKGADDYITKPFNFEILIFRIKNLISLRESLKKNFNKQIDISPKEIKVTSLDEALIQKALDIVEQNISNADFSVEELSRELGMSRVHLYKKLSSLTGKSPIEFIRLIRLKRAAQLLEKSQLTVSEIAYKVGFNNPKYFSKYFKAEYKILPSAYNGNSKKF